MPEMDICRHQLVIYPFPNISYKLLVPFQTIHVFQDLVFFHPPLGPSASSQGPSSSPTFSSWVGIQTSRNVGSYQPRKAWHPLEWRALKKWQLPEVPSWLQWSQTRSGPSNASTYVSPQIKKSVLIPSYGGFHNWLVVSTPLKNMNVNWDDYSQYMGK